MGPQSLVKVLPKVKVLSMCNMVFPNKELQSGETLAQAHRASERLMVANIAPQPLSEDFFALFLRSGFNCCLLPHASQKQEGNRKSSRHTTFGVDLGFIMEEGS